MIRLPAGLRPSVRGRAVLAVLPLLIAPVVADIATPPSVAITAGCISTNGGPAVATTPTRSLDPLRALLAAVFTRDISICTSIRVLSLEPPHSPGQQLMSRTLAFDVVVADPSPTSSDTPSPSPSSTPSEPSATSDPVTPPSPTDSASDTPTPPPSGEAGTSMSAEPSAPPTGSNQKAEPTASPTASTTPEPKVAAGTTVRVAGTPATMTSSLLTLLGFTYDGVATLDTAQGPVRTLKFSMDSTTNEDFQLVGGSISTTSDQLIASGHVAFYATRFTGNLLASPGVTVTFTPDAEPLFDLPVGVPLVFSEVSVDLTYLSCDVLEVPSLRQSAARQSP